MDEKVKYPHLQGIVEGIKPYSLLDWQELQGEIKNLLSLLEEKEKRIEGLKNLLIEEKGSKELHAHCEQNILEIATQKEARIKELEKEKDDLAGVCASTIRKRVELEATIKELEKEIERVKYSKSFY